MSKRTMFGMWISGAMIGAAAVLLSTPLWEIEGEPVKGSSVEWYDRGDIDNVGIPAPSGHGCGEDFHIPDAAATIRLYVTGDYTGDMREQLGEEDSPLVDYILSLKEEQ